VPEYWERYDDIDINLPRIPEDEDPHPTTEWLKIHHGIDQFPPDEETIRLSRRAYYAMISHLDDYLGEIIAELKHVGAYDDTVIVFTSDHGDMLGERGMWFKRSFYQGSLQVPMIFHNPKRIKPGRVKECVTLADLCPTFAELGGAKAVSDEFGSDQSASFLGLLMDGSESTKDEAISEYFGPGVIEPWLAVRQADWKYVWTRNAPELLFNMAEDPDEQIDRSQDPECADIMSKLRDRLLGRYDVEAVTQRAVRLKETRVFLHEALSTNGGYHWDYQPHFDATQQYVRGVNSPSTA
jgi:choline-sulfatase